MAQITIPDALYQRLEVLAQQQSVSVETLVRETLASLATITFSLSLQEEQQIFDHLDRIAQHNGRIESEDWGKLVSDLRD